MRGNFHVRCGAGENSEITSKSYLSLKMSTLRNCPQGWHTSFEDGYAECVGSYELYSDMKSKITITLMKSKDNMSWLKVESWYDTNYERCPESLLTTSTNKLEHGYYYLARVQVQIIDSTGESLETSHCESISKYYA